MADVGIRELLEAGVHFGHQTRRWNPKMRRFIHMERGGIYIIDLRQTLDQLEHAHDFARNLAARRGTLMFVGTNLAFFPQHLLGLDRMIRRIIDYAPNPGWAELNFTSTIGAFMIGVSILPFIWNVVATMRGPRDAWG